jgi:hypothetical protein
MKSKDLTRTARDKAVLALMAPAVLAMGVVGLPRAGAAEHSRLPASFSGLLNDYTSPAVAGGPYEMHGKWSLRLNEERSSASFTAEMTMETADFANPDTKAGDPTKLGPHVHHISMTDGVIHNDLTDPVNWKTQCAALKPPVSDGFVVTGTAYVTGNGSNPSFGNPSPLTICILGGSQSPTVVGAQAFVEFSNFTLTFGARANTHFGTQPINGVITACDRPWGREARDCKVSIVD